MASANMEAAARVVTATEKRLKVLGITEGDFRAAFDAKGKVQS